MLHFSFFIWGNPHPSARRRDGVQGFGDGYRSPQGDLLLRDENREALSVQLRYGCGLSMVYGTLW